MDWVDAVVPFLTPADLKGYRYENTPALDASDPTVLRNQVRRTGDSSARVAYSLTRRQ